MELDKDTGDHSPNPADQPNSYGTGYLEPNETEETRKSLKDIRPEKLEVKAQASSIIMKGSHNPPFDGESHKGVSSNRPNDSEINSSTTPGSPALLRAPSFQRRQRRKSPVTVQEWVASLPTPHLLQSHDHKDEGLEELIRGEKKKRKYQIQHQNYKKSFDEDDECKLVEKYSTREDPAGLILSETKGRQTNKGNNSRIHVEDDNLNLGAEAESSPRSLKFLSQECDANVHKMTSAIPRQINCNKSEQDKSRKWLLQKTESNADEDLPLTTSLRGYSLEAKRRQFLRNHEQYHSFQSDISAQTVSSVDSVLYSREVDPAELLIDLGFGDQSTDLLARVPARFFQPSKAKGISVEDFLRRQEELSERFDSGFSGYRGLNGSSSTRPSEIVEKIIDRIRTQERILKRQATQLSVLSQWTSSNSLFYPTSSGSSSTLFPRFNFASVVNHAQHQKLSFNKDVKPPLSGAKAFKAAAHSVLSPANRKFMDSQNELSKKSDEKKTIIIGGETFRVNEDLNVIDEEEDDDDESKALSQTSSTIVIKKPPLLTKRDSSLSINSLDSDWSDEELEEIERLLDDLNERSEAVDQNLKDEEETCSSISIEREAALARWQRLKKSRNLAMQRVMLNKRLSWSSNGSNAEDKGRGLLPQSLPCTPLPMHPYDESRPSTPASASSAPPFQQKTSQFQQYSTQRSLPDHRLEQFMFGHGDHRIPKRFGPSKMRM